MYKVYEKLNRLLEKLLQNRKLILLVVLTLALIIIVRVLKWIFLAV